MKLLRKINNNAAVAQDRRGREMVVLGRGVGFHPMPYELTDLSVVYRTFYDVDPQYYEMLASLPEEALLAAADITEQAEITLHTELNPNLPFTLADHIAFAQQREKQGIRMAAPLHYDVQHLYPREYELGLRALETVRLRTGSSLPRAEAVSIALHIVNAELEGSDLSSTLTAYENSKTGKNQEHDSLLFRWTAKATTTPGLPCTSSFWCGGSPPGQPWNRAAGRCWMSCPANIPPSTTAPAPLRRALNSATAGIAAVTKCCT